MLTELRDQCSLLIGAAVSFFITRAVIMPLDGTLPKPGEIISTVLGVFQYSPEKSIEYNKVALAAFLGYWAMSIFTGVLDLFPSLTASLKVQGEKHTRRGGVRGAPSPFPTFSEWFAAVRVSMCNFFFVSWFFLLPLWFLWQTRLCGLLSGSPLRESDPWHWQREIGCLCVCAATVDTWFYWTHRALHMRSPINLYAKIHKFHHRFKAPTAVASMYAHPLEFGVGNLAGVALGPVLSNCHPYTAYFWFFLSLWTTGGSHSGYYFLAAKSHDAHHEFFHYHFGVGGPWDWLCGTGVPAALQKKQGVCSEEDSSALEKKK